MQDNRRGAGRFDRRVDLLKPTVVQDADNYNEVKAAYTVYLSNVPAHKVAKGSGKESETNNLETASHAVEWELRYAFGHVIRANWKIRDSHDNQTYIVTAPVTEVGRRDFVKVQTSLIQ